MNLSVEHRPSDSPYVTRVWRSRTHREADEMTAVAFARWDLVFWETTGIMHVSVVGPEPRASRAPVPHEAVSFGINFEIGTVLPWLPASRQAAAHTDLPDVTHRRFHLAGSSWALPTYDNAEAFVERLVRAEVIVRDRLVLDAHRGTSHDRSPRTIATAVGPARTSTPRSWGPPWSNWSSSRMSCCRVGAPTKSGRRRGRSGRTTTIRSPL